MIVYSTSQLLEPNYSSRGRACTWKSSSTAARSTTRSAFLSQVEGILRAGSGSRRSRVGSGACARPELSRPPGEPADPGPQSARTESPRSATPNQVRAIHNLARHRRVDLCELLEGHFGGKTPEELSLVEASRLIDELDMFPISGDRDLTRTR